MFLGKEFSLADVLTHSFLLRLFAFAKQDFYRSESFYEQLLAVKKVTNWHDLIAARDTVKKTWNEDLVIERMRESFEAA